MATLALSFTGSAAMSIRPGAFILFTLLSPVIAVAQDPLNMSISHLGYWTGSSGSPQVIYSDTNGTANFGPRIVLAMSRAGNPAPPAPYHITLTLGPGFTAMAPLSLPSGTTCQPATGGGAAPISIQCTKTTLLTGGAHQIILALDAGPIGLFQGASQVTARYTVDYDAYPLPDPPVCSSISGNTGCVERSASVFASWIGLDSLSVNEPMIIGQDSPIQVRHRVVGYDGGRISTTTLVLPPELEYRGVSSPSAPSHTCSAASGPHGGDVVSCQGNIRHPSPNAAERTGSYSVIVRTRPGVQPPGPLRVYASIGNGAHPAPTDCDGQPNQLQCAEVGFGLATAPTPDLHLTGSTSPQPWVNLGRSESPFRIEYRNLGGATSATPTRILAKLPAGFGFQQLAGSSGPVSCTATGSLADGQEVRCQRSTGVPANAVTFWLELRLDSDPLLAADAGNGVLWAITDAATTDGAALLACAADPEQAHCRWHDFDVRPPCPGGLDDSIYCHDYEVFVPPGPVANRMQVPAW
jgi:hypothetical protein